MENSDGFYTLKGYQAEEHSELTAAMEDYLEMICRMEALDLEIRIVDLSRLLHVKPSSATKMVQQLSNLGYLHSKRYGYIELTDKGHTAGSYLLFRHDVVNRFLCALNGSDNELEQAEKIEHFLNAKTVKNLDLLTVYLKKGDPDFISDPH
ncbi:MAG: metal-dependent transcriptional regulator [Clostridia bacterium]|nr:metal-dependent transcriptional regulator [Clostridia bacterium]